MEIQVYNNSLKKMYKVSKNMAKTLKSKYKTLTLKDGSLVLFNDRTELRHYKIQLESIDKRCYICGKSCNIMTIEHIVPKQKGGITSDENLELACKKCNESKGNCSLTSFVKEIKKNREKYSYIPEGRIEEIERKYLNFKR